MPVNRIKSGVEGLDELIQGGFPEGSSILVTGSPGTGKTIFGLQFLVEGAVGNEPGIFLTFEESKMKVYDQGELLGWDLQRLEEEKKLVINSVDYADVKDILRNLAREKKEVNARRLVVDSLSTLFECARCYTSKLRKEMDKFAEEKYGAMPSSPEDRVSRDDIFFIIREINKLGLTSVLISEAPKESGYLSRDTISEFVCDGVIVLTLDETMDLRRLGVKKLRGTKHTLKLQTMQIGEGGIKLGK
jgi:KaiC/GvpD/RAD55 family RecA-like ATPase